MKTLRISDTLSLPLDTVTQTVAIVAKRRAGKSYLARRIVEQLYRGGQQVVIVDPKGDWWGIRSSSDGKSPGLPIIIFGGERGDVPLEASGGELVARICVEERVSALLDLSLFRKHEVATFMTAFMEALYRLKSREMYRTPMMLVLDEADAIAPQNPAPNEARMLGAADDIVRRGGQRGIGCMPITQRTAVLNKNILTQAQVLIALRTIAPQDLKAMGAWIDVHGEPAQRKTLMDSLPSLPVGDAWVWSPGWPTDAGIFHLAHVLPIETFDSGATPKPGAAISRPKTLAQVDIAAVTAAMAETIARQKADDPKALRAEIAEQKKRVADLDAQIKRLASAPAAKTEVKRVEVPVITAKDREAISRAVTTIMRSIDEIKGVIPQLGAAADQLKPALMQMVGPRALPAVMALAARPVEPVTVYKIQTTPPRVESGPGDAEVGHGGVRRILIALAQRPQGLTNRQIGVRAGLSSKSGTFSTYISRARQAGWLADDGNVRRITDDGLRALGSYEPLPTGGALLQHWLSELGTGGAARILRALADAYPKALTNAQLGESAGISHISGTFSTYVSRLRTLELIVGGRGQLSASEELFE